MEDISAFIKKLENEMDEIEPGTIKPATNFRELEQWSSMMGLIFIALVDSEYDILLNGDDLQSAITIQDLYDVIRKKKV